MFVDLSGKVAIVTGAGQGIGAAIAKVFAKNGASIIIATRSSKNGEEIMRSIKDEGGEATFIQCDVGENKNVKDMVEKTIKYYGRIDIAIHNAAVFGQKTIDQLSDDALDETLSVNMKAAFWLTKACVPFFRKQGLGRIIVTSSVTGPKVAMPGTAHYAMSKGGMNAFIKKTRLIWCDGAQVSAKVYERLDLPIGGKIVGPALLEQPDTTIFIEPNMYGEVDHIGNLLIRWCEE